MPSEQLHHERLFTTKHLEHVATDLMVCCHNKMFKLHTEVVYPKSAYIARMADPEASKYMVFPFMLKGYSRSGGGYDTALLSALFAGFYSSGSFYLLSDTASGLESLAKMAIIAHEIEAPAILEAIVSVLNDDYHKGWENADLLAELLRHVYVKFPRDLIELKKFLIKILLSDPENMVHNPAMHRLLDEHPEIAIDIVKQMGESAVSANRFAVSGGINVEGPPIA